MSKVGIIFLCFYCVVLLSAACVTKCVKLEKNEMDRENPWVSIS